MAQMGPRQVNKHCECNVLGQRYGRMPLSSLPTKLVSQLHTWESGCGSNPGSRRQMLTRSSESIHPTSTVLTQSQLFSQMPQQSDHSLTLFVLSSLILQLLGSCPRLRLTPLSPILTFLPVISPESSRIIPEIPEDKEFSRKQSKSLTSLASKGKLVAVDTRMSPTPGLDEPAWHGD